MAEVGARVPGRRVYGGGDPSGCRRWDRPPL